jgi:hypothetical protein
MHLLGSRSFLYFGKWKGLTVTKAYPLDPIDPASRFENDGR